jgi:hypothetical protein
MKFLIALLLISALIQISGRCTVYEGVQKVYLVKKNTNILIVDSAYSREDMEDKRLRMPESDRYEVLHWDEVYRRIMG